MLLRPELLSRLELLFERSILQVRLPRSRKVFKSRLPKFFGGEGASGIFNKYKRRTQGEGVVSTIWVELRAFLCKILDESRAFVDSIWSNVKRDSQNQLEEAQDWASHLEHLQSILLEFDADGAPEESSMLRFFHEGLKPSMKAQMEQCERELDSCKELVEKASDAEAKAG